MKSLRGQISNRLRALIRSGKINLDAIHPERGSMASSKKTSHQGHALGGEKGRQAKKK